MSGQISGDEEGMRYAVVFVNGEEVIVVAGDNTIGAERLETQLKKHVNSSVHLPYHKLDEVVIEDVSKHGILIDTCDYLTGKLGPKQFVQSGLRVIVHLKYRNPKTTSTDICFEEHLTLFV